MNPAAAIDFSRGHARAESLTQPVAEFLANLHARKYSPQSVNKRADDLRKLMVFLEALDVTSYADVTLKMLEDFRLALTQHGYSASVLSSAMRCAALFFRFLAERGMVFEDPARRLKISNPPRVLGKVLTAQEAKQVLALPDLTKPGGIRDRAIMETLYATGMRRGEMVGLRLHDVDLDHGLVLVTGKGSKQRKIPLGRHAVKYVQLYLQKARPLLCPTLSPAPDALWLNRRRGPLRGQDVTNILTTYSRMAGMEKNADAHTWRRTCATQMLRGGAHPVVVAEMLGHTDLRVLAHYLQTNITDLMKAHAQSNPGK